MLIGLIACEEQPQPKAEEEEDEPRIAIIEPRAQPADEEPDMRPEEPVELRSWPGRHEQMTFDLTWLGGDEEMKLRDKPDVDAEVVATKNILDGEQVDWLRSRLRVDEPRIYIATDKVELIATPYLTEEDELGEEELIFVLEEEDPVFLYEYAGEESCLLGVHAELVVADCPEEPSFVEKEPEAGGEEFEKKERWKPLSSQWWVKVDSDEGPGWFEVADAPVDVHTRRVEGYDKFGEPEDSEPFQ